MLLTPFRSLRVRAVLVTALALAALGPAAGRAHADDAASRPACGPGLRNVQVEGSNSSHSYRYTLACADGTTARFVGTYAPGRGDVWESLTYPRFEVQNYWHC